MVSKTHKATGPDAIGATILKATGDIIAPILQIIFQTSLDTGRVPTDWNAAFSNSSLQERQSYPAFKLSANIPYMYNFQRYLNV